MKIRLAKTAGFCMGVRRAVDMVLDLQRGSPPLPIVTYGPLIHNPQTLELLESRGIRRVDSLEEVREGTAVIRAHGISPRERRALVAKGVHIVDATCPRVSRVQMVIRKHAREGHFCIIVGDEDHPEVRGLLGFAEAGGVAVSNPEAVHMLDVIPDNQEVCIVAQTTQEMEIFEHVVQLLDGRFPERHVYNTICDSTKKRQAEVGRLASQVDMIVVVGGRGSGNTRRLAKVAGAQGIPALHVETAEEILPFQLAGARTVGVTAGASTPNWQIRRVIDTLMEIGISRRAAVLKNLRKLGDIAVMTYLWAALGGGGLTAASLVLQRREVTWLPVAVTMLFVFSMHLLNRIQERSGAVRFNTPEIAAFYSRHGLALSGLAVASSLAAVVLSYFMGLYSCLLLVFMAVTGKLYTSRILSDSTLPQLKWRSLRNLPGSKTPLVAAGWAVSGSVLPVIGSPEPIYLPGLAVAFAFAAGMVFWRTAMSDLLDIQGDRIVGRETIPILMGVTRTRQVLLILLVSLALLLGMAGLWGVVPTAWYWLQVNVLVFAVFFVIYRRGHLVDRLWFEGVIDGNFVLAGGISLLYGLSKTTSIP